MKIRKAITYDRTPFEARTGLITGKECTMGDKGGKKDKDKSQKQKKSKQDQKDKKKSDNQPKKTP